MARPSRYLSTETQGKPPSTTSNASPGRESDSAQDPKDKIKEVFFKFDKDRNGVLSRAEVQRLMKAIGGAITPAEIDKVFEQVDSNGDDAVDIEEFIEWIMSPGSSLQVQDDGDVAQFDLVSVLRPLFQVYDKNNNGSVNL